MNTATSLADFLDLSYRPDLHILTVRWLRAVSHEELQAGFEAARRYGQERHAARWLVDVRRRTELDASSSAWVAETLLPAAAADVVPARLQVAYLLSPARVEILHTDKGMHSVVTTAQQPTQSYQLQTFLDEGPAVNWLLHT
ncbi:hypothetical protein [Hymenobacter pini]|uniref:hypothetical protein n=1 Tax=Hymenobacter pini TaxID=2880879 RepID=UPI001CF54265|nr:hypothetical protein [Hymenobacter pini]MCA8829103.1 hypothetical protein [Hymenobacter pini]